MRFRIACIVAIGLAFTLGYLTGQKEIYAQSSREWEIWEYNNTTLFKIQDGNCSIYLARSAGSYYSSSPIALATGQGCK